MKRVAIIYVLSFILLSYIYQQGPSYIYRRKSYPDFAALAQLEQRVTRNTFNKNEAALLASYVRGGSKNLSPGQKKNHRALNLQHLWSPSGIHLAAALLWLTPLLPRPYRRRKQKLESINDQQQYCITNTTTNKSPKIRKVIINLIWILLYTIPWSLPGYYAIKRICLLKIAHLLLRQTPWRPDYYYFFLAIMGLDFFFGTYQSSPLSFAYSFLFLGVIVAAQNTSPFKQSMALMGGQILANYFSYQAMTLGGHFLGQILTSIFALCFPVFFISYWGQLVFDWPWAKWPIHGFNYLVEWSAALAISGGYFYPSWNILLFMAALFLPRFPLKLILLTMLLILHSDPCFNQSRNQILQKIYVEKTIFLK